MSKINRDIAFAFPKNNAARDVMIDSPSRIDEGQLREPGIGVKAKDEK